MKRTFIGALVGAILIFGWQATANLFMHHHDSEYKQISGQDNVIQTLSGFFKEDGQYLVPRSNPNVSQEEMAKYDEGMKGKPWALITYHHEYKSDMGMSILRSFVTDFLSVLIFIWLIGKTPGSFFSVFTKSIGVASLIYLFVWYNNNIWLQTPWGVLRPELVDLLIAWALCGIWLGWWLNRTTKQHILS